MLLVEQAAFFVTAQLLQPATARDNIEPDVTARSQDFGRV